MSRGFSGPHGLTDIELSPNAKFARGKLYTQKFKSTALPNMWLLEVVDEDRRRVLDAFQDIGQPLRPALEYLADLAGAATGLEVEIKGEVHGTL